MLFVLSHRHGWGVKDVTSGKKAGKSTWEGFCFIFTKPCHGGIFKFVLDSFSWIPSSSLVSYWNYWKMVGFHSRRGGVSAAGKKSVRLCLWGLQLRQRFVCINIHTSVAYNVYACMCVFYIPPYFDKEFRRRVLFGRLVSCHLLQNTKGC